MVEKILSKKYFLIYILISLLITSLSFFVVKKNDFFVIHDQAFWISLKDIQNNSFVLLQDSMGRAGGIQLAINFINQIPYRLLYLLGISSKWSEFIFFNWSIFTIFYFSHKGFFKIAEVYFKNKKELEFSAFLACLIYFFNLFTIININTGIFWSLTYICSYAFFPLCIYSFTELIKKKSFDLGSVLIASLLIFLVALNVPFLISLLFCLLIVFWLKTGKNVYLSFQKGLSLMVLFIPLFAIYLVMFYYESIINSSNFIGESLQGSMAGAIQGGVLTMFLHYFSWILYTPWLPKSVLTFSSYYFGLLYIISLFSLYLIFFFSLLKQKKLLHISIPFLLMFFVGIFFGKGGAQPFGAIFVFLINKISLFSIIRSPDNKFSIVIMFALSVIVLLVLNNYKNKIYKRIFVSTIIVFALIVSYPLLTKEAIIGKNNSKISGDFIVSTPKEYIEVADIINKDKENSNVIMYPPESFLATYDDNGIFIGRDILKIYLDKPVLYFSDSSSENPDISKHLKDLYLNLDMKKAIDLSSKYVVVKKDTMPDEKWSRREYFRDAIIKSKLFNEEFKGEKIELYSLKNEYFKPKVTSGDTEIKSIEYLSPVKINLDINKSKNDKSEIVLNESFNKNWKIYISKSNNDCKRSFCLSDLKYLWAKPLKAQHIKDSNYANKWIIDNQDVANSSNNDRVSLRVFYIGQAYFYLGFLISIMSLLSISIVLLWLRAKRMIKRTLLK